MSNSKPTLKLKRPIQIINRFDLDWIAGYSAISAYLTYLGGKNAIYFEFFRIYLIRAKGS